MRLGVFPAMLVDRHEIGDAIGLAREHDLVGMRGRELLPPALDRVRGLEGRPAR
jgi:hypothetical protein